MLRNTTLATRLCLGLGLLLLAWVAMVSIVARELAQAQGRFEALAMVRFQKVVHANLLVDRANEIARGLAEGLLEADADAEAMQRAMDVSSTARVRAQESVDWMRVHQDPVERAQLDVIERARSAYVSAQEQFFTVAADAGRVPARVYYLDKVLPLEDAYVAEVERLTLHHVRAATAENEQAASQTQQATQRMIVILVLASALVFVFAIRLGRSITLPLGEAVAIANRVAAGHLDFPAPAETGGEVGRVLQALHAMAGKLREDRVALGDSERLFRLLAEHSSDIISLHGADCRYTYVSPACQTLLGRNPVDLVGKTPEALVHPDDMHHVHSEHDRPRGLREDRDYQVTFRVRHPDGSDRWIEAIGRRISEPGGGRSHQIVSVMRDITERHVAEQRLLESLDCLARSQTQAQLGSWRFDLEDRQLTLSEEACRLFGCEPGQPVDEAWFKALTHPGDRGFVSAYWTAAQAGEPGEVEYRILVDGQVRWVACRCEPDRSGGARPRLLGVTQDISVMKAKEMELLHSRQQLRDLAAHHEQVVEKRRSHVAREIHDELGQCLSALRMEAAMLRTRFGEAHPDIVEHIANMKRTIDQTMTVVREVVATLRPGTLDEGLVPAAEWLLADFQRRTGVAVALDAPDDELELEGDLATAAFRILQEALTNAGNHARASRVSVFIGCADGLLTLRVQDDGIGFAPHATGRERTFGLLGMRERALMFSGAVSIDSAPGHGTTLHAEIPLSRPATA